MILPHPLEEHVPVTIQRGIGIYEMNDPFEETFENGAKARYENCILHCIDGPAAEYPDGEVEWWIGGQQYLDINQWANDAGYDVDSDEFTMLKLQYG